VNSSRGKNIQSPTREGPLNYFLIIFWQEKTAGRGDSLELTRKGRKRDQSIGSKPARREYRDIGAVMREKWETEGGALRVGERSPSENP